ncbi:hypothetical protein ACFSO0_13915 [Brevibacillus sp. GCM10020057]|uniref:hypothetical protein n=1 Tax=Brevibacillus sp. GCM10020057 TaxID=3317327 RepID=UPI0036432F89
MKRKPLQGCLAAALLVTSLWSATPAFAYSLGEEIKIDANQPEIAKTGYDISEDYAVWMVEGEKTITLYDLDDNSERKIGSTTSVKTNPKVDGNYVVWIDSRDGGSDVYMYDIAKKKESRLSSGSAKVTSLEIRGKNVVWDDKSNGGSDIYLCDITTGEVEAITTSGKASNPTLDDTYIAWQDSRNGDSDIYTYNLKTKTEKAAVTAHGDQIKPSISDDYIVFEDHSGEYSQIGLHTISKDKTTKLTDDASDKEMPHIFNTTYVFIDDGSVAYGGVNKSTTKEADSFIYDKLAPRVYDDYILYAKMDNNKKLRLNLYDMHDKEMVPIGSVSGEPSQPAGHDRYVVYISEGNKTDSVILHDVENGTSKAITKTDASPSRPLVSNHYVVWYDNDEDALFSYDIKKGVTKQVTNEDDDEIADEDLYELDGDNLLWVNAGSKADLVVTNLATGKSTDITTLKKEPLSIDIHGNYVSWVLEQSSKKASVFLYDMDEEDEMEIRKNVQVEQAKLGDDFVVWSEYTNTTKPTWDLFYYDIDRGKTSSLLRYTDRDQIKPQVSRNMVLFQDNRLSPNAKDFYYELYDVKDGSYSDYYWDDDAEVEDARIGGNRIVWIDNRDDTPYVYTMAIAQPQDDDDSTPDPDPQPEPGEYKEYSLLDVVQDGTFNEKISEAGYDNFVFVFFGNTSKEVTMTLNEVFDDMDRFADLFLSSDVDEMYIRIYK